MPVLEISGQKVTFRSQVAAEPGQTASIQVGAAPPIEVHVESCRPIHDGGYLVVALAPGELPPEFQSENVLGDRRAPRLAEHFRVMSNDLPGYQALTVDVSLSGLQLETHGPLPLGSHLQLDIGLLDGDVRCRAEVVWCRSNGTGRFRVGCRFVGPSPRLRQGVAHLMEDPLPHTAAAPVQTAEPESAPLDARLTGYEVVGQELLVHLELPDGTPRELHLGHLLTLSDQRGLHGLQVGYLVCSRESATSTVRFLNRERSPLLEATLAN